MTAPHDFEAESDTIAAISTPPGTAWRGILRLSGPEAWDTARGLFAVDASKDGKGRFTVLTGTVRLGPGRGLPAHLCLMRRPRSYTRQDVAELHVVGNPVVLEDLLARVLAVGVRHAKPGEFTRRAFLNGRITLTQAEGVQRLIRARSDAERRLGAREVTGVLSRTAEALKEEILDVLALVELRVDFSDQDLDSAEAARLRERIALAASRAREIAGREAVRAAATGEAMVHLTGPVNAGKSSLFNRIAGQDRAIVHATAGTTRDTLCVHVVRRGIPFLLFDGPGWGQGSCSLEGDAMDRQARMAGAADIVVHVVDASLPLAPLSPRMTRRPDWVVLGKADLPRAATPSRARAAYPGAEVCVLSALTGEGVEDFLDGVAHCLAAGGCEHAGGAGRLNVRQREAFRRIAKALKRGVRALGDDAGEELAAIELREAVETLDNLEGVDVTEAVLDRIFSDFCIGK